MEIKEALRSLFQEMILPGFEQIKVHLTEKYQNANNLVYPCVLERSGNPVINGVEAERRSRCRGPARGGVDPVSTVKKMKKTERDGFLEDLLAATSPEYLKSIREARADYKAGRIYSHDEVFG
jgi:hypothetical protein